LLELFTWALNYEEWRAVDQERVATILFDEPGKLGGGAGVAQAGEQDEDRKTGQSAPLCPGRRRVHTGTAVPCGLPS